METGYKPIGYCLNCGYQMDPGVCPECGRAISKPARRPPHITRRQRVLAVVACAVVIAAGWAGYRYREPLLVRYAPNYVLFWFWSQEDNLYQPKKLITRVVLARREALMASQRAELEKRRAAIDTELEKLERHAWAGWYNVPGNEFSSMLHIENLWIAPDAGFVYECNLGYDHFLVHGTIAEITDEHIRLSPLIDPRFPGAWPHGDLIRVTWNHAQLLIPETEMVDFANTINGGGKQNHWSLERMLPGDEWTPIGGARMETLLDERPPANPGPVVVPERFRWMLLSKPIEFRVLAMLEQKPEAVSSYMGKLEYVRYEIRLDRGRTHGAFPGMSVYGVTLPGRSRHTGRLSGSLTKVEENVSTAELSMYVGAWKDADGPLPAPRPGDVYSTFAD